jgi:hypothetical protein
MNRALRGWIFRVYFVMSEEREEKRMQEQLKLQEIPVKVYRTDDRLMVVAPTHGERKGNAGHPPTFVE